MSLDSSPVPTTKSRSRPAKLVRLADLSTWIVVLLLIGYPLLGTLVAFTSLPSLVASVPVRALILIFSLLLIFKSKRPVLKHFGFQVIFLFWLLYFLRLLWDMFMVGIPVAGDFMFNFILFSIVPAFALMHVHEINEQHLTSRLLTLGSIACVLAMLAAYTNLAEARSFTDQAEGRLFLDTVNPITYGHVGVTTIIAALAKSQHCTKLTEWMTVAVAGTLGILAIQLSGSRGPLVSLLICIVALAFIKKSFRWMLLPLVGVVIMFFSGAFVESDNLLASRLSSSVQSDNSEVRIVMQAGAIQQFLDNPILGSAILEQQFQDYPHNLFVESAMALGICGLLLIVAITSIMLRGVTRHFQLGTLLIPLLALQYLSAAQFSGSIAASSSMWALLSLVAVNQKNRTQRKSKFSNRSHLRT